MIASAAKNKYARMYFNVHFPQLKGNRPEKICKINMPGNDLG
jgi:hypothetical protein